MFKNAACRQVGVLIVGVTLVAACGTGAERSPSPSASESTADRQPSASPSASVATLPAPSLTAELGLAWNRVDDPDLVSLARNGSMYGVIAGGPGAIAWGSVYATGPRIWTTTDGLDWTAATIDAAGDADAAQGNPGEVLDVIAGGPGYVAVGVYSRAGGDGNTSIVWTSPDGITWRRVAEDPALARSMMSSIVSWKGELFAYGCANVSPIDCGPQRVWASSDGLSWEIIEPTLPTGTNTVSDVRAAPEELWGLARLSSGDETLPEDSDTPHVLVSSTDGRTWTRSSLPAVTWGEVYWLPLGWFATVAAWPLPAEQFTPPPTPPGHPSPGVYRSPDRATWALVSKGLMTVGEDLIAVGDTLIMVGDDAAGNVRCWADCQATGWRSVDGGVTWQAVPADKVGGTMTSVAALPDGTLVAVGRTVDGRGSPSTAAWVSIPDQGPFSSPSLSWPSSGRSGRDI